MDASVYPAPVPKAACNPTTEEIQLDGSFTFVHRPDLGATQ